MGDPWPNRVQPIRPPRVHMWSSGGALPAPAGSTWTDGRGTVFVWVERLAGHGSLVAGIDAPAKAPRIVRLTDARFDDDAPAIVSGERGLQLVWLRRQAGTARVLAAPLSLAPVARLGVIRQLAALGPQVTGFAALPPVGDSLEILLVREGPRRVTLVTRREGSRPQVLARVPRSAFVAASTIAIEPGDEPGALAVTWREQGDAIGRVTRDPDGLWHAARLVGASDAATPPPRPGTPRDRPRSKIR